VRVVLFLGPSLSAADARAELGEVDALLLPPVSQGDVIRVMRQRPFAIGVIDGYFDRVPSVWHKEILWALKEGVHVLGAASMGALRAAELAPFGMVGVGAIYEEYRSGRLTDDDEVAVVHGREDDLRPLSEAMVNVRATLVSAVESGVLSESLHQHLLGLAKQTFYAERTWPRFIAEARSSGWPIDELDSFVAWLSDGAVNQKRLDALELVRVVRELVRTGEPAAPVPFHFEHTSTWEIASAEALRLEPDDAAGGLRAAVLDEARLHPDFPLLRAAAFARLLAGTVAGTNNFALDDKGMLEAIDSFRRDRDLLDEGALDRWAAERRLESEDVLRLIRTEAARRFAEASVNTRFDQALADEVLLSDTYDELSARAERKRSILRETGHDDIHPDAIDVDRDRLYRWWFNERNATTVPDDLGAYARHRGLSDEHVLRRVLLQEWWFERNRGGDDVTPP
jgi:hypothetical protein